MIHQGQAVLEADRPDRLRIDTGSVWEPICGYSRAVRVKDTIRVSGTTATHGGDRCVAPGDAGAQTTYILDKIVSTMLEFGPRYRYVVMGYPNVARGG